MVVIAVFSLIHMSQSFAQQGCNGGEAVAGGDERPIQQDV